MLQFMRKASIDIGPTGKPGLRISGLRITFEVKKTSVETYNTGKVTIYNLTEETRNKIDAYNDTEGVVVIRAGYEEMGELPVVFVGDITLVNSKIERPDVITTIEALDGYRAIHQLRIPSAGFKGSFAPGSSAKKILQDLVKASGIDQKATDWAVVPDKAYANGFSFHGMGKVLLNNLCTYLGLEWSIQNNQIKFVGCGSSDKALIVKLTPDTGLIGSPERLRDIGMELVAGKDKAKVLGKETTAAGVKERKKIGGGWKVTALLQPTAEPGGVVQVQSAEIPLATNFRVVEATHTGDTHGDDWTTAMIVMPFDAAWGDYAKRTSA